MVHHGMTGFDKIAIASTRSGNKLGDTNYFGRLLDPGTNLKRDEVAPALAKLAQSMDEGINPDPADDDPNIPLGFVFLGQFIDHDITLDVTSGLKRAADINSIPNIRTPVLDLDSIYGDGPEASSYFYRRQALGKEFKDRFLIGNAKNPLDFPRTSDGVAIIGDPRNDENGLISQLHLLFLRFHNAVLEAVENEDYDEFYDELISGKDVAFQLARRAVRRHYQWIVVNEFLPKIVDAEVLKQAKDDVTSGNYQTDPVWKDAPTMPIEFSGAAYRFGHSMVRNTYTLNAERENLELFKNKGQTDKEGLSSLNYVPPENVLDWRYFFEIDPNVSHQKVRRIDTQMAHEFYDLPFVPKEDAAKGENSLAFRNLLRGVVTLSLPSGEAAAKAFGVTPIPLHPKVQAAGLKETPLWFYCLAEGEHYNNKLGPVGGRIVAMTLLRMLDEDPKSYLNRSNWKPFLGERSGSFTMADLVKFVEKHEAADRVPINLEQNLSFDGANDYVEVPYNSVLNPQQFTISVWVKVEGGKGQWRSPITSRHQPPLLGYIIYAGTNNKWQFWVGNRGSGWRQLVASDVVLNTWTHVATTFDGDRLKLYINGELIQSGQISYVPNPSSPLRIGAGTTEKDPSLFFSGKISEVRIWNLARTQEAIKEDLNYRLVGNEPGLVGYWPLNEGSSNIVYDKSSHRNHGMIYGATWSSSGSEPQPQPVVNFGEHFYLNSEDGKSIIASWKDPHDGSYHRIYPKFGASGQIALKFQGGNGELTNNSAVQLVSTESSIGQYNIMGAWRSKNACYYWTNHNSQMQWWQITKVDGGDGKIRYGDKVYITNRQWNQPLAPYSNGYVSGKVSHPQYVWILKKP